MPCESSKCFGIQYTAVGKIRALAELSSPKLEWVRIRFEGARCKIDSYDLWGTTVPLSILGICDYTLGIIYVLVMCLHKPFHVREN